MSDEKQATTTRSQSVVTITVSAPVGSGKSMVLTEIEAAMQVAGADVVWARPDRDRDLMSPATLAARGLTLPRVVLVEHNSGSCGHWDAWYAGLPADLKRKLSLHDFKRLGEAFKAAFLIQWDDSGRPT
jgi:Ni2+-binding GTPase involved in maturation of urease and hydrogenase